MDSNTKKILFRSFLGVTSAIYFSCIYYFLYERVFQEKMGYRYDSTLEDGIDFTKPGYPSFLSDVSGLSHPESWGRWSDAKDAGKYVQFTFKKPLPKAFNLELKLKAYGPNQAKPIVVLVGSEKYNIYLNPQLDANKPQLITLNVAQKAVASAINTITIIPGEPTSPPKPTGFNPSNPGETDQRLLGIGLISIRILNAQN